MRNILLITSLLLAVAFKASAQTNGAIHLAWNYADLPLLLDQTNNQIDYFYIRASSTLTGNPAQWPVVYGQPWTSITVTKNDGTNSTFYAPLTETPPGQEFFVCTISNFWGESAVSNMASTPPLPTMVQLQIFKGP